MTAICTPQQLDYAVRSADEFIALTLPPLALMAGVGVPFIVNLEAVIPMLGFEQKLRVIQAFGMQNSSVQLNTSARCSSSW